jgi:nucleoside-diphosphate-sugar epimerase
MTRHLITGGAGFIGSNLAHRLIRDGHDVTVLDRFSRGKSERLPAEVTQIKGDICDPSVVLCAVGGCDVVWHLAYVQGTQTFYADPKDVIDVALLGIINVLRACELQGLQGGKDLILVSSSEVYQNPPAGMFPTDETVPLSVPDVTNPRYSYGGGKIASELAVLAYAQAGAVNRAVIVRPHNVIGPDMGEDHVVPQLARRVQALEGTELPIQGDGLATRCFNYIDDAVEGLLVAYEHGETGVYHLGDPREEVTIGDLAHDIAGYYGREVTIRPSELPKGSPTRRKPDIRKLQALGYEPKVGLLDALAGTLPWYSLPSEVAA